MGCDREHGQLERHVLCNFRSDYVGDGVSVLRVRSFSEKTGGELHCDSLCVLSCLTDAATMVD